MNNKKPRNWLYGVNIAKKNLQRYEANGFDFVAPGAGRLRTFLMFNIQYMCVCLYVLVALNFECNKMDF